MKRAVCVLALMLAGWGTASRAVASETVCDGPVLKPGSSFDSCGPKSPEGGCPGFTSVRNDYFHCGGSGFSYCNQATATVGQSHMPCTQTVNMTGYILAYSLWQTCSQNPPPQGCGSVPLLRDYVTCSAGSTGGSPIQFPVVTELGDDCVIAKLQRPPSASVAQLALAAVALYGQ